MDALDAKVILSELEEHFENHPNLVGATIDRKYHLPAIKFAVELLKKNIPTRAAYDDACEPYLSGDYVCSSCEQLMLRRYNYCPKCGQRILWD